MSTPEGKVKRKVKEAIARAEQLGVPIYAHWPVQSGYGSPTLDCIGCRAGHYFAVETKAPGKSLTARQQATIEEMKAAGARIFVIGEGIEQRGLFDEYSGLLEFRKWLQEHL